MPKSIEALAEAFFAAKDGVDACKAMNSLAEHAILGSDAAIDVLASYVTNGPIDHIREFACARLAETVKKPNADLALLFRNGLSDDALRYWSILGYVIAAGKSSYGELTKIAQNKRVRLAERCQAVKCLAVQSGQKFDRQLPTDPGYWKESDLRLAELKAWAEKGYPKGSGYRPPKRHAALETPRTAFERLVSRFDKKLAAEREEDQDLADPTNWLAIATVKDIAGIKKKWKLPLIYLEFLTRFSPIKVTIKSRKFYNHFQLFGAGELVQSQNGYSFNPVEQKIVEDWPADYVVIASHGGDPFVLDLSNSNGKDAPVRTARHGMGIWKFKSVADSFVSFLETLAK